MPLGKVRFYDSDKGFGFLTKDEGGDVYVRAEALPAGTTSLKSGARVEFGVAQGQRGDQALQVRVLDAPTSVSRSQAKARRKQPEDMVVIVEDLITLLDTSSNSLRRGHYPDARVSAALSKSLRGVADQFEAGA